MLILSVTMSANDGIIQQLDFHTQKGRDLWNKGLDH